MHSIFIVNCTSLNIGRKIINIAELMILMKTSQSEATIK